MAENVTIQELLKKDGVISEEENTEVLSEQKERFELRKLAAKDIRPMLRIIKKVDLKKIKSALEDIDFSQFKASEETEATEIEKEQSYYLEVGKNVIFEAIPMLLDMIDCALVDFNSLLADLVGLSIEELESLDLDIYFQIIYDFLKKEELMGFIKVASKFLNSEN